MNENKSKTGAAREAALKTFARRRLERALAEIEAQGYERPVLVPKS